MQSDLAALTRFDVVLWFLRVQLWLSVIFLLSSFIQPFLFVVPLLSLQNLVAFGIPVLVLLLFPKILAASAVGRSAPEPITSVSDLRPLVLRCVGLFLFIQNLGGAVMYSLFILYTLVASASSMWFFSSSISVSSMRFQIVSTAVRFLLGFFLAFGPAIRGNFRAR